MTNKKRQKYINILLIVGVIFVLYPFFGMYTLDRAWNDVTFISILFSIEGAILYGRYIIFGVIIITTSYYLDKRNI